jgi:hypothetical protein
MPDYLALAKQAYEASTTYIDANYRADWDYSLRAFRNEHAAGSKYLDDAYKARSRLFRPKTRSIIRKNEAAAAVALFSNMEVVDIGPGNPDDVMSVASASAMKSIIEYRLSRTIPAFPLVMGAIQDAQTTGTVCSYQYWEYQRKADGTKVKDKPCIELRPVENIRLDAGADWLDPVNSSPYFCDIVPMYVCDVRSMMTSVDDKTEKPKWKKLDDAVIMKAKPDVINSTRQARLGKRQDPEQESSGIKDFDIVWVMRWLMRDSQNEDKCFYTLGTEALLSDAKQLSDEYFHGKRPYVMGCAILETHKALKTSMPMLVKPLQQEVNQISNSRSDNVQFVLNKRWLVARGRQVDTQSLVRNVPGGVTLTSDPKNDIVESNWPDVTSSAYVEHDRLNAEFDDLAGNFSPSTRVANNAVNDTLGGSRMANQSAGIMTDYLLRTIIETWWEPVLRQLVMLEQHYETDDVVLSVCANKARLFPRFGISRITDMMLMNEVNVTVNVGMGASNPNERFQRFMMATQAAIQIANTAPPGFNVQEMIKEIYSNAGQRDGSRFVSEQQDPRLMKLMQAVQQMRGMLEGKQMQLQQQTQVEQLKLTSNERIKGAQLQVDQLRIQGDLAIRQAELAIEQQQLELEKLKLQVELQMSSDEHMMKATEMGVGLEEAKMKVEAERQKIIGQAAKIDAEIEKARLALQTAKDEHNNEGKITKVASDVIGYMQGVSGEMAAMKSAMQSAHNHVAGMSSQVEDMKKGLGAMAGMMMQRKKSPKGFTLKKPDGKKTSAVVVQYDDGSTEEMKVM